MLQARAASWKILTQTESDRTGACSTLTTAFQCLSERVTGGGESAQVLAAANLATNMEAAVRPWCTTAGESPFRLCWNLDNIPVFHVLFLKTWYHYQIIAFNSVVFKYFNISHESWQLMFSFWSAWRSCCDWLSCVYFYCLKSCGDCHMLFWLSQVMRCLIVMCFLLPKVMWWLVIMCIFCCPRSCGYWLSGVFSTVQGHVVLFICFVMSRSCGDWLPGVFSAKVARCVFCCPRSCCDWLSGVFSAVQVMWWLIAGCIFCCDCPMFPTLQGHVVRHWQWCWTTCMTGPFSWSLPMTLTRPASAGGGNTAVPSLNDV